MWVFFITILAVSADAYVAGLSLGNVGKYSFLKVLYAASFTLWLSGLFVLMSSFISGMAADVIKILSACILILIGLKNIKSGISEKGMLDFKPDWTMSGITLLGVSVAVDAAVASVSLASTGSIWLVPVCMFAGHFLFLWAGSRTAKLLGVVNVINRFSGGFLVVLGLIRLFQ